MNRLKKLIAIIAGVSMVVGVLITNANAAPKFHSISEALCQKANERLPLFRMLAANPVLQSTVTAPSQAELDNSFLNCDMAYEFQHIESAPNKLSSAETVSDLVSASGIYYVPLSISGSKQSIALAEFTMDDEDIHFSTFGYNQYANMLDEAQHRIEEIRHSHPDDSIECNMAGILAGDFHMLHCINKTSNDEFFTPPTDQLQEEMFPDFKDAGPIQIGLETIRPMLKAIRKDMIDRQESLVESAEMEIGQNEYTKKYIGSDITDVISTEEEDTVKTQVQRARVTEPDNGAILDISDVIPDRYKVVTPTTAPVKQMPQKKDFHLPIKIACLALSLITILLFRKKEADK